MSFIDLMGNHRWTAAERRARTEALVASTVPAETERIMTRRALGFLFYSIGAMLPDGHPAKALLTQVGQPLAPEVLAELMVAAQAFAAADAAASAADADISLLNRVLDAEEGIAPLADDDTAGHALAEARAAQRVMPEEEVPA